MTPPRLARLVQRLPSSNGTDLIDIRSLRGSGILPVGAASRRDSVSIAPGRRSHAAKAAQEKHGICRPANVAGARAALSEAGINWVDETGAAEIAIGTVVVSKSGTPGKKPDGIRHWTPAVIAVTEALLCGIRGTQSEAQSATGLSAGSCANALRFLSDQKLLTSTARRGPTSGRRVADQRALLDAYVAVVAARPSGIKLEIAVSWQDILQGVSKLGHQFDARGVAWAVTGGAAAAVIAPHISSLSRAAIYVDAQSIAELEKLALLSKLRPLEGGRLTLKPFPTGTVERLVDLEAGGLRIAP